MTRAAVYGSPAWRRWKHDHHWATTGAPADPLGAGNTALIAALGGNSAVLGFHDARLASSLTISGSNVAAWADVRGAGFGPTINKNGANAGAVWDAVNLLVKTNGTNATAMFSSAVSLYDTSQAISLVLVGACVSTVTFASLGRDAGTANQLALDASGSVIRANGNGTGIASAVALSTTVRVSFAAKNAGTTAQVEVPSQALVSGTIAASTSAANRLQLGIGSGLSALGTVNARALLVLAGVYTTAQRDAIKTWATTYHGVTLA